MLRDVEGFRERISERGKGLVEMEERKRGKTKKGTNVEKHRQEADIKTNEVKTQWDGKQGK